MNVTAASRCLKLNPGTVTRYIRAKRLKATRSGVREWDIAEADLQAFAQIERKRGPKRTRPVHIPRWRHLTPTQRTQLFEMKRAGVPQKQIAAHLGISESAVSHMLKRAQNNARSSDGQN